MNANKKVTLQMERNYPNIYSGTVYFRNLRTGCELLIQIPRDLNSYGISSITLDSGARKTKSSVSEANSYTVFPQSFASKLDVQKPLSDAERYYVFRGVGGLSIAFLSPDRIMVGVQDDNSKSVCSLDEVFPFLKRRLKLEVDTGLDMDYILIGRDWQEEFDILFRAREISIFGR